MGTPSAAMMFASLPPPVRNVAASSPRRARSAHEQTRASSGRARIPRTPASRRSRRCPAGLGGRRIVRSISPGAPRRAPRSSERHSPVISTRAAITFVAVRRGWFRRSPSSRRRAGRGMRAIAPAAMRDCGDALLRRDARVRRAAPNGAERVVGRRGDDDAAGRAVGVEHEAEVAGDRSVASAFAPTSPISSCTVNTQRIVGRGSPVSASRRTHSMAAARPPCRRRRAPSRRPRARRRPRRPARRLGRAPRCPCARTARASRQRSRAARR